LRTCETFRQMLRRWRAFWAPRPIRWRRRAACSSRPVPSMSRQSSSWNMPKAASMIPKKRLRRQTMPSMPQSMEVRVRSTMCLPSSRRRSTPQTSMSTLRCPNSTMPLRPSMRAPRISMRWPISSAALPTRWAMRIWRTASSPPRRRWAESPLSTATMPRIWRLPRSLSPIAWPRSTTRVPRSIRPSLMPRPASRVPNPITIPRSRLRPRSSRRRFRAFWTRLMASRATWIAP
jgi:Predicted membrane protein